MSRRRKDTSFVKIMRPSDKIRAAAEEAKKETASRTVVYEVYVGRLAHGLDTKADRARRRMAGVEKRTETLRTESAARFSHLEEGEIERRMISRCRSTMMLDLERKKRCAKDHQLLSLRWRSCSFGTQRAREMLTACEQSIGPT